MFLENVRTPSQHNHGPQPQQVSLQHVENTAFATLQRNPWSQNLAQQLHETIGSNGGEPFCASVDADKT